MANPGLPSVDTTPSSDRPPAHFVESALKALLRIMNPLAAHRSGQSDGTRDIEFVKLRKGLEEDGHARDAAEWAIHEHVLAKPLEVIPGPAQDYPGFVGGLRPPTMHGLRMHGSQSKPTIDHRMYPGSTEPRFSPDKERSFIRWTEALRVWWHEIDSHRVETSNANRQFTLSELKL